MSQVLVNVGEGADVDAQKIMTEKGCVIGQSGSGKSYLVGVITEELCRLGLPFMVVDTDGEYSSLKSSFGAIWIGEGEEADIPMAEGEGALRKSVEDGIPVILDVSESKDKAKAAEEALSALYRIEEKARVPYVVIVEEADKFAPQAMHKGSNMLEEISVRGRKRGLGLIVATQRPANISKTVLSQCSYGFVGRLTIENDIKAVSTLLGDKAKLAMLPKLESGRFVPFGLGLAGTVTVKRRVTVHKGLTPRIGPASKAKEDVREVLRELKSGKAEGRARREVAKPAYVIGEVINGGVDMEAAERIAENLARKQYLLVGPKVERVERLQRRYERMLLLKIRVPEGDANEYAEYYAVVGKGRVVQLEGGKPRYAAVDTDRPHAAGPIDAAIMRALAGKRRAGADLLAQRTGEREGKVAKRLEALLDRGLVEKRDDLFALRDRRSLVSEEPPRTTVMKIDTGEVQEGVKDAKKAQAAVASLIPGSKVVESREVYLPSYAVELRQQNRMRLFRIDGISGEAAPVPPSEQ